MTETTTTPETSTPDAPAPPAVSESLADRLADTLLNVLNQACGDRNGRLDSYALRAYQEAIRLLAELRMVTIEHEAGRRTVARLHGRLGPSNDAPE